MYFWKIDSLKKDLAEKSLSESDSLKYLIITSIAVSSVMTQNVTVYEAVSLGIIDVIGTLYIYICNHGKDGENFLQRFIAIGWVVMVRWFFLFVFPMSIAFGVALGAFSEISDMTTAQGVFITSLFSISYFWIFGKHIKDLVKMKKSVN